MKKRELIIREVNHSSDVYSIEIYNARYQPDFVNFIKSIVNCFFTKELFFSFYRVDGIHLSQKQQQKLEIEIPLFFQRNGILQELNEYVSIAKTELNDEICGFLPSILDYFLEISLFNLNSDWNQIKNYHMDYLNHSVEDIISNHFADIVFLYFDSGDVSICFNSKIYDSEEIRKKVIEAIGNA